MDPKPTLELNAHSPTNGTELAKNKPRTEVLPPQVKLVRSNTVPKLKRFECFCVIFVFLFWLALFTGGITVDTRPSRCLISAEGVRALEDATKYEKNPCDQFSVVTKTMLFRASGIILLWFLPINLALVCASAGVLGTFGNRADLSDDASPRPSQDDTNPYISATLRGFFVYLIMISGMLLLDVNPFSNPSPGQYIRLAGFLSLFGFVVSYQPRLFREIVTWTYQRIEQAEGPGKVSERTGITVHHEKETHESETIHAASTGPNALSQLPSPATNEPSPGK
jgi:hypothetical protein